MPITYSKVKTVLGFKEGKPTVYKITQQTIPAVTFSKLVDEVAQSCAVNPAMSKAVVEAMINRMCHYMELGHMVQMGEFGSFKPTFTTKTQASADKLSAKNVKARKIRFYPGQRFKDMLSNISIVQVDSNGNVIEENPTGGSTSGGNSGSNNGGGHDLD